MNKIVSRISVTLSEDVIVACRQKGWDCLRLLNDITGKTTHKIEIIEENDTYRLTSTYECIIMVEETLKKLLTSGSMSGSSGETDRGGDTIVGATATNVGLCRFDDDSADTTLENRAANESIHISSNGSSTSSSQTKEIKRIRALKQKGTDLSVTGNQGCHSASQKNPFGPNLNAPGFEKTNDEEGRKKQEGEGTVEELAERPDLDNDGATISSEHSIEVDKVVHEYLMKHFQDEIMSHESKICPFEEDGKHMVGFKSDSITKIIRTRNAYKSCQNRIQFEIYHVPSDIDGSVLGSAMLTEEMGDAWFVPDEDYRVYKLIGNEKAIAIMKNQIEEHMEMTKASQASLPDQRFTPTINKRSTRTAGKTAATLKIYEIKGGQLTRKISGSKSTSSVQIKILECPIEKSSVDAVVCFADCKLQCIDSHTVETLGGKKFGHERSKAIQTRLKGDPIKIGNVIHMSATGELEKAKIRHVVFVVLLTGSTSTRVVSEDVLRNGFLECLQYAHSTLKVKSISFPLISLISSEVFVHSAVEALRTFGAETYASPQPGQQQKQKSEKSSLDHFTINIITKDKHMKEVIAKEFDDLIN